MKLTQVKQFNKEYNRRNNIREKVMFGIKKNS